MAPPGAGPGFAFLYQSDRGEIDARTWLRGALPLFGLFLLATAIWLVLKPYATRGLDERRFFDTMTIIANVYLLAYALGVMLLAISWVNLGAKRFRDRGEAPPVGLAGVLPLVVLLDGALHWLQPQIADELPGFVVYGGDALVAAALVWTAVTCADLRRR